MMTTSDYIICFLLAGLFIGIILYFSIRKELRLKRMSHEDRRMKQIQKQIWLNKNSFGAVLYKIGRFLLLACVVAHITIQHSKLKTLIKNDRLYRGEVAIVDAKLTKKNRLDLHVYNGLIYTVQIASRSRHIENLIIEELSEDTWKRMQDSTSFPEKTLLRREGLWEQRFQLPPQTQSFRVGIPWMCEETGESGIAWSKRIDPPRKVSKGK